MKNTYKTSEVAKMVGVHVNTVRLYEELELIPIVKRLPNGYRVFTDYHIEQFNLARTAFKVEVLQNGLRKKIIEIVKLSAKSEFEEAINLTNDYINQVINERSKAEEAIELSKNILLGIEVKENEIVLTRSEAADYLQVTIDTLRNWELNGLFTAKRKKNGYRIYTESDLNILKIIRTLRCANYSLSSILRMLNAITKNNNIDIKEVINNPEDDEEIVTACDKLLTSLNDAEINAKIILNQLEDMKSKFNINSTL